MKTYEIKLLIWIVPVITITLLVLSAFYDSTGGIIFSGIAFAISLGVAFYISDSINKNKIQTSIEYY